MLRLRTHRRCSILFTKFWLVVRRRRRRRMVHTFDLVADVSHVLEEGANFVIYDLGVCFSAHFGLDLDDLALQKGECGD